MKQASQVSMISSKSNIMKNNDRYNARSPYENNSPTNETGRKHTKAGLPPSGDNQQRSGTRLFNKDQSNGKSLATSEAGLNNKEMIASVDREVNFNTLATLKRDKSAERINNGRVTVLASK